MKATIANTSPGHIVQIDPDIPMFGGCMVTVTKVRPWGIQGYVQVPGQEGQAYIRREWSDIEHTGGQAVWMAGSLD